MIEKFIGGAGIVATHKAGFDTCQSTCLGFLVAAILVGRIGNTPLSAMEFLKELNA